MKRPTFLFFCDELIGARTRSGIQRVVYESARALASRVNLSFVKWDRVDGQLRYLDSSDLSAIFGADGEVPATDARCHRVMYRFSEVIDDPASTWLVFPEVPYLKPGGNEVFARLLSQCREYGVRIAAVLYDLIPLLDDDYAVGRADHAAYAANLLRCDALLPISRYSGEEFLDYFGEVLGADAELETLRRRVFPLPLGENREGEPWGRPLVEAGGDSAARRTMIMVGTVEPRKQQARALKALNDAAEILPELREVDVEVFGSLHPGSVEAFHRELGRNPRIRYHHYASDAAIEAAYAKATFSVFPSRHEGYGLPIVESLRRGVPCLTADFGAMVEAARGGGCMTVNVRNDAALREALTTLCLDDEVTGRLRREIPYRTRRSWGDYANDMVAILAGIDEEGARSQEHFRASLAQALSRPAGPLDAQIAHGDILWRVMRAPAPEGVRAPAANDAASGAKALLVEVTDASHLAADGLVLAASADVLLVRDRAALEELVAASNTADLPALLPDRVALGSEGGFLTASLAVQVSTNRDRARRVAYVEGLYARACARLAPLFCAPACELAVVMSTYNRGPFIEMNVEWLLRQIDADGLPVKCVVVDNSSTDDTEDRLSRFGGHPRFVYVNNPANVGMLGNLRVCSALDVAPYVWLTGDDDFVVPGALARALAAIRENPGLPLLFHNFGVYHREAVRPGDSPEQYIRELFLLTREPSPAGVRRVNEAAGEHDNLFTAIYPIMFRSDVLAACFNYPFEGTPFGDLVECVPTTKMILGTYRYAPCYWFQVPGIAGNAHNSWAGHRPRWHLVLMPAVFDLAREAGVDPRKVWDWTQAHFALFEDAARIAGERGVPAHLDLDRDMDNAWRVFRRRPVLPASFTAYELPPAPLWRRPSPVCASSVT